MADCPHFTELRKLVPYGGYLRPAGAARIAAANPFPALERLSLSVDDIDKEALGALFGGAAFRVLRELKLSGGRSGVAMPGVENLCSAPALTALKSFEMSWRPTPGLTQMLTTATFWPGLEELDLLRNDLGDSDLAAFLNTPGKLRRLDLDDNKITSTGAKLLAEHPVFANIVDLDLGRNAIGDSGLSALVKSPNVRNLQKLDISSCGASSAGIIELAESPHLSNLRELWMHSNGIDLKAARALCASPHLRGLTYLYLGSVTGTAKKELKARFGSAVSC